MENMELSFGYAQIIIELNQGAQIATCRIAFHVHYHRELRNVGKRYLREDGKVEFPCPYCDHVPFTDFAAWKTHKYQGISLIKITD